MVQFGEFLLPQHREDEAETLFLEVLKEGRQSLDRNHGATNAALALLPLIYLRKGDLKTAEGYLIEAVEITRSRYGPDIEMYAKGTFDAGMLLVIEQEYARGEPYLIECRDYWVRNHPDQADRWWSELRLGICLLAQGKNAEALSQLLLFYNAMGTNGKGGDFKGEKDLRWVVEQITQLRDQQGQPLNDSSLARLRTDPHLQAIILDLQFPADPFVDPSVTSPGSSAIDPVPSKRVDGQAPGVVRPVRR